MLPSTSMERLLLATPALPCPRIPRARIARYWEDLDCSSSPSSGQRNGLLQKHPLLAHPAECSQLSSTESLSMDGFWMEVERIQQKHELKEEDGNGGEGRFSEGEAESQWLQDTGLADLLDDRGLKRDPQELLSTLTQTQVAAVCRRLNIYVCSARRRHKAPVRDVRDIFGVVSSEKFRISKGRLGLTRIGDLSLQDMKKIPALALIELTALCDVLGLELKRNKAGKRRPTEIRLFGMPLDALLEADRKALPSAQVPLVLQALLTCLEKRGLDTEGILRVPGSQARVKGLEQKLEREFYSGLFSWEEVHHHDASDLLKRFIRELPAPLLTAEYLPAFAVVPNIPDLKQRLQALHLLILILPEPNRNVLKALLEFLRKVVAREKSNKMSLWNVSTVMAPNLFLHRGRPPKLSKGKEKQLAEGAAEVVQMMVQYQDLLWTVASFLVAQVRKLNDSSTRRSQLCDGGLKTWLRRTHADREQMWADPEAAPKVAKIQVAWSIKDPLEVPLTPSTKVVHVLRQFTEHLQPGSQGQKGGKDEDHCLALSRPMRSAAILLYEVGGNIREHRLDPDAYLLDLYRANPHGEWVLKQSPT
ncbi:rho GTPase-activating protein 40 isoform X4 [Erinaceus europaeus]|uniref:Rho GTPase-activating protein 40 isoform X4 n=1 Tax=Erinaceus europaeus TaxID=9365 RepID=A0ABM3XAS6_ERIEU|nr:rho GTPase-activating protein 40 isoform X4 [Erinaceus europaeus]